MSEDVAISQLYESKSNPRKVFADMDELVASVKEKGVLVPLLVRKNGKDEGYEVIAGARRYRAAKLAGVERVPVRIMKASDDEVLEMQIVENLQRADVHPLEEAAAYERLSRKKKTVAEISAHVGRSIPYVYGRMKLLDLIEPLQKEFIEGKITAGHAVALARLTAAQQKDIRHRYLYVPTSYRLFEGGGQDWEASHKAISVRELEAVIAKHVRLDVRQAGMEIVMPEVVATVKAAEQKELAVVPLTREFYVPPEAKAKVRTYGPRSWKQVKEGSCEHVAQGLVVVGAGRGDTFPVCIARKKCGKHWKATAAKKTKAPSAGQSERDRYAEELRKSERERKILEAAMPDLAQAVAERVLKMPVKPGSLLWTTTAELRPQLFWGRQDKKLDALVSAGKTPESLIRFLAYGRLLGDLRYDIKRKAKALGIDTAPILAKHAAELHAKEAVKPAKEEK